MVDETGDQLGLAAAGLVHIGVGLGRASRAVIDQLRRDQAEFDQLHCDRGRHQLAVGSGAGGGDDGADEMRGGGEIDVVAQVAAVAVETEGRLGIDGAADHITALFVFDAQRGLDAGALGIEGEDELVSEHLRKRVNQRDKAR